MPGFYRDDEYDLAGFAVGIVDRSEIIDKESVRAGDIVLALPSSEIHSRLILSYPVLIALFFFVALVAGLGMAGHFLPHIREV